MPDAYQTRLYQNCYNAENEIEATQRFARWATLELPFQPFVGLMLTLEGGGWAKLASVSWDVANANFECGCHREFLPYGFEAEHEISEETGWSVSNIIVLE
tara:strand:- start:67 stop:369 length:303 start_codon:yes stop_codon:yes gene_type:complete